MSATALRFEEKVALMSAPTWEDYLRERISAR